MHDRHDSSDHQPRRDEWPRISVITPSFNQAVYLERTIRSVLDQGYPDLEYLIIDGGSTDGSREIIRKYEKHIAWWESQPDRGQSDALNKGFARASGEVIGWINSDDMYCEGILERVGRWFASHPESDVVGAGLLVIDADDRVIDALWATPPQPAYTFHIGLDLHQQALFWRRSLMEKVGLIDPGMRFSMDYDFILRLLVHGRVDRLRGYGGMFRLHSEAKTARMTEVAIEENEISRQRYRESFPPLVASPTLNRLLLKAIRWLRLAVDAPFSYIVFKLGKRMGLFQGDVSQFLLADHPHRSSAKESLR